MNISELLQMLKNNPGTMSMGDKLLGGMATTLLAMGVVFIILLLIAFIISIINTPPKEQIQNHEIFENIKDDTEIDNTVLTAIITGAIVASGNKNIVVKRITRSNNIKSNWEKVNHV